MPRRRVLLFALGGLLAACGSTDPCAPVEDHGCPDLRFGGQGYDESRTIAFPRHPQEVGNATYPACNDGEPCSGPDLGGFGATDVWLLEGTDPNDAVIGLRQGTHTAVVFVRQQGQP